MNIQKLIIGFIIFSILITIVTYGIVVFAAGHFLGKMW